ncbi:MAG: DUF547 domain-containing protein [Flavobacteriaceae bacterium]|nr:DUF547 domain-containing protein [Flavobacteriaceae bacterium]NNJ83076.1 DUF547 domain-containing protein [Flavobacteriaceae bacterium]
MRKIQFILLLLIGLNAVDGLAQSTAKFFDEADSFFKTFVSSGRIDYARIHESPTQLNSLLELAKNINVRESNQAVFKAFWINTYNLTVIKGIIDNYPLESPLDVKGFFDITQYDLAGESITLNDIENRKLRAIFDDPRIHFVLVCGAQGCPPIISEAYFPSKLGAQLQRQTRGALNDPKFVRVADGKVALSEIFKWYREDFVKNGQTEVDFINKFRKEIIPADSEITYYPYNWKLNSK